MSKYVKCTRCECILNVENLVLNTDECQACGRGTFVDCDGYHQELFDFEYMITTDYKMKFH